VSNYLVFLDGIVPLPQVAEFLGAVQERTPDAEFVLLISTRRGDSEQLSWLEAARLACDSLETLRAAELPIAEAVVGERGGDSIWEELRRSDRSYDCVLCFTPYRRGMHVQRLVPHKQELQRQLAG
jgi:hypothetical protein